MLQKYGLQTLSDPDDLNSVKTIVCELAGTRLMEAGQALGGNSNPQMYYQRAIVEQNFIMIRQLDRLLRKIDEIKA